MRLDINFLWYLVTCIVFFILLMMNITRHTLREAIVCFLVAQVVTWFFSTIFVELYWETCPVRLFPNATRTDFIGDYFTTPSICTLFYFQYIKHQKLRRILDIALFALADAIMIVLKNAYTDLRHYVPWAIPLHLLVFIPLLPCSVWFTRWFFKQSYPYGGIKDGTRN